MDLSRRDAIIGSAALAAASLISTQAGAATPVADKQAPSFYRYKVGDIVVTVVSDGKYTFQLTDAYIPNALVAKKLQVQGFHYPFPGLGNVVKDGDGYRVIPASWNPTL
jgi:hypothetical protein